MQRTSWIRSSLLAVAVGLALATPAWAATPDTWITTKTKLALLTTEGVSGTAIKVDTVVGRVTLHGDVKKALDTAAFTDITVDVKNGVVRLTGTIPTGERRLEAARTARAVSGVRAVEDDLRLLVTAQN